MGQLSAAQNVSGYEEMDDIQEHFLDIVRQVRSHLELQRALGLTHIEQGSAGAPSPAPDVPPSCSSPAAKIPAAAASPGSVIPKGLEALEQEVRGCSRCGLSRGHVHAVFGEGHPEAVLVFIGDMPGQEGEEKGPFTGAAGQLLSDIIVKGMKLKREEVYVCTIVKCSTPGHRKPAPNEIKACEDILLRQIRTIAPKFIVALGSTVASALLKTREPITALRGKWHTWNGIRVMPTFHPAHLLKKESDKRFVWGDIKKVMAEMEKIERG